MRHLILSIFILLSLALPAQTVISIKIDGAISPVAASFIHRSIEKAEQEKVECLLIHLNTPGGLLNATRTIVGDMLESKTPIVVYVSPSGAHAGSAGVFITLAADIAAMSPGSKRLAQRSSIFSSCSVRFVTNSLISSETAWGASM